MTMGTKLRSLRFMEWMSLLGWICMDQARAGEIDIIYGQQSGASGFVAVQARVRDVVSLSVQDSVGSDGNLVNPAGINFGDVNNLGTTETPGVKGSKKGNIGHYEAEFSFSASRSGPGNMNLICRRSSPGNFNAKDGVEIDDSFGALRPVSALDHHGVVVLENAPTGIYDRTLALNIHPSDKGSLRTVLQFTLSAL